ncbi:MAG TPA: phospho-N-acetylmuramoyl-pentapeptide-transferase [Acidimicrobiia bacterium]|nr:phospho-N-acetylmuramoyl-pentapeptide-transferase [Acidimicrobiia bacterium]
MIGLLLAASTALILSLVGTPILIRFLQRREVGQLIRDDGPEGHHTKAGTPTMGGIAIVGSAVVGYGVAHLRSGVFEAAGLSVLLAAVGLALVGFIDDYLGVRHRRNLGLKKRQKSAGQLVVGVGFALMALHVADASTHLSFTRDLDLDLGTWLWIVWATVYVIGSSNAVNLTDGLDGLASGSAAMVFGAFVIISFWQVRHPDVYGVPPEQALDLAVVAAAMMGACAGFLWWNAAPARIFMGDTGSLAVGAAIAGLALLTRTHLLLPIIAGLYVIETLSVIIQVVTFRGFGKRWFRMAPIHHHFELLGWPEFTVIVRFWLIAGLLVSFGLGVFYADFITIPGVID